MDLLWPPRNLLRDEWLVSTQASRLFLIAALCVIALLPFFLGLVDPDQMSFWRRLPWGLLGIVGPVSIFFLWIGMWRYWIRIDDSSVWSKRGSFLLLLLGVWYGATIYYFFFYLPQTSQKRNSET